MKYRFYFDPWTHPLCSRLGHGRAPTAINDADCTGCGKCVTVCPVEAMTLMSAHDPKKTKRKSARLNQ